MKTITRRPYQGEADLPAISDLLNICEAIDHIEQDRSIAELKQELDAPWQDPTRNLYLWEDENEKLIGFGLLSISLNPESTEALLQFCAHPQVRSSDLEQKILAWGEKRILEVKQESGLEVKLRSTARTYQSQRVILLENSGFTRERYFHSMKRSLNLPIPQPQLPPGFTIRPITGEQDIEAWVEMFNQTFIDHWNHQDLTIEEAKYSLRSPTYRPELDLITLAPDGTFAAFCHCDIFPEHNQHHQCHEGWISILGTRRGFRQRGLGRAMLLTGMQALQTAGIDTARIAVDSENPSSAKQLYESVGFQQKHTQITFVKNL